jgi:hypothetical protein
MHEDLELWSTKPGTAAGRYMRLFWHPVYVAEKLKAGKAVPIRILNEDFTRAHSTRSKRRFALCRIALEWRALVLKTFPQKLLVFAFAVLDLLDDASLSHHRSSV